MYLKLQLKQILLILLLILNGYFSYGQCDNVFQKLYGFNNGNSIGVNAAVYNSSKELLVCGNAGTLALIAKFDPLQNLLWAKTYSTGINSFFRKITALSDGGIGVAGVFTGNDNKTALCLLKVDPSGAVIWTKRFLDISAVPNLTNLYLLIEGIAETPDKGLVVCGRKVYQRPDGGTNYRTFIFKVNSLGIVEWTREDTIGNDDEIFGMAVNQAGIHIVGTSNVFTIGKRCGFFEKIDATTGAVQFLKFYYLPDISSNLFRSIEANASGFEIGTQAFASTGRLYYDFEVNNQGDEVRLQKVPDIGLNLLDQFYHPVPMPDGSSVLWKDWYYSSSDFSLAKINSDRISTWAYQYTLPGKQNMYSVLANNDNTALIVGTSPSPSNPNGPNKILLNRTARNGLVGSCVADNQSFSVKDTLNYQVINGTWQTSPLILRHLSMQTPLQLMFN